MLTSKGSSQSPTSTETLIADLSASCKIIDGFIKDYLDHVSEVYPYH